MSNNCACACARARVSIFFIFLIFYNTNVYFVYFCRTDAGVHAFGNTATVELENKYNIIYNSSNVKKYVNRYFSNCGHDIR